MTVRRNHTAVDARHCCQNALNQCRILVGCGIAHRIRNVERGCTFGDDGSQYLAHVLGIGTRGIHRGEFDVVA